jgi:HD superfamily phosphohydrolase
LIESLEICENEAGGMEMAIHESGVQTFEALVLARYQLSTQVLYHPVRCIYDLYLTEYHMALPDSFMDTPAKILRQNDITMLTKIVSGTGYEMALFSILSLKY